MNWCLHDSTWQNRGRSDELTRLLWESRRVSIRSRVPRIRGDRTILIKKSHGLNSASDHSWTSSGAYHHYGQWERPSFKTATCRNWRTLQVTPRPSRLRSRCCWKRCGPCLAVQIIILIMQGSSTASTFRSSWSTGRHHHKESAKGLGSSGDSAVVY